MGGKCAKPTAVEDSRERLNRKEGSLNKHVARVSSSRREEVVRPKGKGDKTDVKVLLIDKRVNGSNRYYDHHKIEKIAIDDHQVEKKMIYDQIERKKKAVEQFEKCEVNVINHHPAIGRLPKGVEGEQVAAGWPTWLATVAGEAIKGWIPRRANTFEKLDKIGQGTYSSVYRARDVIHDKIVALKKVRFDNQDPESVKFMAREIAILRKLDHPNIIKLEGLITSQTSCSLYLVFEYMEHDLVGLASLPGMKFTESQVKCYMKQLLSGLEHCHGHGVLHRDIKGSNLLLDHNGILKIADFGLASFFDPKDSVPMTSRVVTLWYRPPELLLGASHYGAAVDLWSTGCILGELFSGKPVLPGKTEVEQLHRIFKLCGSPSEDYWRKSKLRHSTVFKPVQPYRRRIAETFKDFPASALGLMETLMSIDPAHRGTAALALNSEFFTTQPLACDPSNLPKYPPSKEIDAKLRDEESRRQGVAGGRDQKGDLDRSWRKEYLPIPAPNRDAELSIMQKRHHTNSRSKNEMFISQKEAAYAINPTKQRQSGKEASKDFLEHQRRKVSNSGPLVHGTAKVSHSGPLIQGATWAKVGKGYNDPPAVSGRSNLATLSGFVASRTVLPEDHREKSGPSYVGVGKQVGGSQRSYKDLVSTGKQDCRQNIQKTAEPSLHGGGPRGNKIFVSGPLLPTNNVDQLLKEHDQHIQEFARRARLEKIKPVKAHA